MIVIKSHLNLQNQEENSHLLFLVDLTGKASETCEEVQKETELCHLQVCKFCHFWFVWLQTVNLQRDAKGDRTLSFESFAVFGLFGWEVSTCKEMKKKQIFVFDSFAVFGLFGWHLASVNLQRCAKGDKTFSWAENF